MNADLSIGAMFSQHDSNVGVSLATRQEERRAAFLCPTFYVGVARHEELSQLKETFLGRQCNGTLSVCEGRGGGRKRGGGEEGRGGEGWGGEGRDVEYLGLASTRMNATHFLASK